MSPIIPTQAQLIIDVYPSQDNPDSETIWIFSDSSTAFYGGSIRSSQNYHARDSWKFVQHGGFYTANNPTNQLFNLSPLFSSTNNPKDIDSIMRRLPGSPGFGQLIQNIVLFSSSNVHQRADNYYQKHEQPHLGQDFYERR